MERHWGATCASSGKIHYVSCIFGAAQKNMYLRFLWPRLKGEKNHPGKKKALANGKGLSLD
jgi:hypothetical protein